MSELTPMIDHVAGMELHHGERGDADPEHPEACFCGAPEYFMCPGWAEDEDGFLSMTIYPVGDGNGS